MYSILSTGFVETNNELEPIRKRAVKFFKQRKTATIYKDGKKIGWVGEDLTRRVGWGCYIEQ